MEIDRAELPALQKITFARSEATKLFISTDREPVLKEVDAVIDEHPLKLGGLSHKFEILRRITKAHHAIYTGAVVPGAIEERDFACRRKAMDVALKEPLALLSVARLLERPDMCATRIEMLRESLDRAQEGAGWPH